MQIRHPFHTISLYAQARRFHRANIRATYAGRGNGMSLVGWIFFGLVAGFIASKLVSGRGAGCLINIALGILGAAVGGALFDYLGHPVWFHFSFGSMVVAILGAAIVLIVFHALRGRH